MLHDGSHALVVDPGDEKPVLEALQSMRLQLQAILVTHHHADHVGGVIALQQATGAEVYGPAGENIPAMQHAMAQGDRISLLGIGFEVLDVPGHTAGHIAWYAATAHPGPLLFCGDTLFSGGCGRLFEGTPAQMLASLDQLCALPPDTRVCCAHEYTLSNLRFARAVEPDNVALADYERHCRALREQGQPTLPSRIGIEQEINPFLRSRLPGVREAVRHAMRERAVSQDDAGHFAALRLWKNEFR